jgi:hypothetical protein
LASKPVIEKVQRAYFSEINKLYTSFMGHVKHMSAEKMAAIEDMRRVGQITFAFLADADIPGGQLTVDLYGMMAGKERSRLNAPLDFIKESQRIANDLQQTELTIEDANRLTPILVKAQGSKNEREKQTRVAGLDALAKFKLRMKDLTMAGIMASLRESPDFYPDGPDGHLRDDLVAVFGPTWLPEIETEIAALQYIAGELRRKV